VASDELIMTYIGGPTALLELAGLRLLTDPTFDPAGSMYAAGPATYQKLADPALGRAALGRLDAVLLSHDHHFDNLDHAGRALLAAAALVLTTPAGADRLGRNAAGLAPWQTRDLPTGDGRVLHVTGTPARHGPAGGDRGPVTGFVLALSDQPGAALYISGDTVWYEGIAEVAWRFPVEVAVLFMGAARLPEIGPHHLTMTAADGIDAARAFPQAAVVPLHCDGWTHYTESRETIEQAFTTAGLGARLCWLMPGAPTRLRAAWTPRAAAA
jgi:L-ascorbate metabolism protein UlaG (beta-lactamase superfamily)